MHHSLSPTFRYPGLGRRFAGLVIDITALSLVFFPVTRIVKGTWVMGRGDHAWSHGWFVTDPLCLVFLAVIALYFILLEGIVGTTIGKRLTDLQVVLRNGTRPRLSHALVRNLLRVVDALPALNILGVILILTSPEGARFGDRVAQTRVIRRHG